MTGASGSRPCAQGISLSTSRSLPCGTFGFTPAAEYSSASGRKWRTSPRQRWISIRQRRLCGSRRSFPRPEGGAFELGRKTNNYVEVSFAIDESEFKEAQRVVEIIFCERDPL